MRAHLLRVKRLLESGECRAASLDQHLAELKEMVERIDEGEVRRVSRLLKALADPIRIKVLHLLKRRPMCSCEIMVALGLTEPNTSHHLSVLEASEVVTSEKRGKWTFYTLNRRTIEKACDALKN
ncbi:MAG: metalloregulator ArsR/SmtB family transcription factor [Candidatus Bathyarchaeia archaeon]